MRRNINSGPHIVVGVVLASLCASVNAQVNETPSSHVSVVVAPSRFEFDSGEATFLAETGDPSGQRYITLSLQQTTNPGLTPIIDLLDHIERVDGSYSTGVLLHTGHGGQDHSIIMESFTGDDAQAATACQNRLTEYGNAGWDIDGADREIECHHQVNPGQWSIYMFDRAVTNRGVGLATDNPLVYIATCYGELMGPAYTGKGARVALGDIGCIDVGTSRTQVQTVFKRMNGREGQAKRPVSAARAGLNQLAAVGAENTTLAPSVVNLTAPCPIKTGDLVTISLDTTCEVGITPDIVGAGCTIENEVWLNATTLQGACTAPPPPGAEKFTITLEWNLTYSDNNTARLDGNTDPVGINARGPAHDDYVKAFACQVPAVSEWGLVVLALLLLTGMSIMAGRRRGLAKAA